MGWVEVIARELLEELVEQNRHKIDEFWCHLQNETLQGAKATLLIASAMPPSALTGRTNSDAVRLILEYHVSQLLRDMAEQLPDTVCIPPSASPDRGEGRVSEPVGPLTIDRGQSLRITTAMLKQAADERERRKYLLPQDWDLELLPNQRLADLQELGFVSGDVTAHTLLLGDSLEHDLAPAFSGAVDSLRPADIAFGEMDMGYDGLTWVSDATLEGLTVNAAAMSGAVTPWAAGISEWVARRRRELEAFRPQPAPRRDSPPGSGSSGGGLSWDEGLELYRRRSGETAENIEWIRKRPDEKAGSGPNKDWTFRDIVRDAVEKSGEVPLFAMGGMVPGMVAAPVPAVVHGGERVLGAGNAGGVPINLEVHVHGTVISEGDLARNVRDGLMRRFA